LKHPPELAQWRAGVSSHISLEFNYMTNLIRNPSGPRRCFLGGLLFVFGCLCSAPPLEAQERPPVKPAPAIANDSELEKLYAERLKAAQEEVDIAMLLFKAGNADFGSVLEAQSRLSSAEVALAKNLEDEVAKRAEHVKRLVAIEKLAQDRAAAAVGSRLDVVRARSLRLDAEIAYTLAARKLPRK
jgi:hypothetical protein